MTERGHAYSIFSPRSDTSPDGEGGIDYVPGLYLLLMAAVEVDDQCKSDGDKAANDSTPSGKLLSVTKHTTWVDPRCNIVG